MSWFLNTIYTCLLVLLAPLILWRMIRHGRYRQGSAEKLLGRLPVITDERPVVWFHAVSVGEILQLQNVVAEFRQQTGDCFHIVVSTSTDTGYELATTRYSDCTVTWFPLDFSWAVSTALRRVHPQLVVLAELEVWPGFLNECHRRGIETAVINARMSDRSFPGYCRIRRFIRPVFAQFAVVAAQCDEYAERLIHLGANPDCTTVTGSIKFDGVNTDRENHGTQELRHLFNIGPNDSVLIAGSTQDPEEMMAVNAWQSLRTEYPGLRVILVPRHRERFEAVAAQLRESQIPCWRRSEQLSTGPSGDEVILLDTIGELSACWGLADVAFVGGSFGPRGGQNMLEPAAYGAAVLFGPSTRNFRDIVTNLLARKAAIEVPTIDDFESTVRMLLTDAQARADFGGRAQAFIVEQRGAIDRTVRLLMNTLPDATTAIDRTAA